MNSVPRRLTVVDTEPARRGPDRALDRRLTFAGVLLALAFVVAAAVSLALPPAVRLGWWLPLHLALAGAAGTAIAAMLPFFVAALSVARPAPPWLHGGAILLVASGAALAAIGRSVQPGLGGPIPTAGAALFVAGAVAAGLSAFLPLRAAAGPRRPATEAAYLFALASACVGVSVAGLYLAGTPEVISAWGRLRVGHAWLNVFGFVGLTVAGTLLHFAPTVAGARIRSRRSGHVAVPALVAGVAVGSLGYGLAADDLVRGGAALLVIGAAALAWHGVRVELDKAGWTTDRGWHRLTAWSLLAAPAWLLAGAILVAGRALTQGAAGSGWRLEDVAGPVVVGFALQVLLGATAHLVPAIGPGDPIRHAAARRRLGTLGTTRVVAWNVGTAALAFGLSGGVPAAALGGGALLLAVATGSIALVAVALLGGTEARPAPRPSASPGPRPPGR